MADELEAQRGHQLAEPGNTGAKLLVPSESIDNDELTDEALEDPEGGPEGGEAA